MRSLAIQRVNGQRDFLQVTEKARKNRNSTDTSLATLFFPVELLSKDGYSK